MASLGRSAPLPTESGALVADPAFQEAVERSRSLTQKILLAIPDTHSACIHTETLQLNSPDNAKLEIMAANIGIPAAPVLRALSENFTLRTCLRNMTEGLQLHRALLSAISERLPNKMTELTSDIKDLSIQINKMQKMVYKEAAVQPTPTPAPLQLQGEYEVQVAAHLILVQLQSFGRDMDRCLRTLDRSNDDDTES
ncbi:colony stimulating factor 3 (granulocyte) a [Solea solea]|uniref:colony stimulating factor 3 (granulocyte) a n=1 Tax=Solea solea TaxID=90069 RepID=UPI00272C639B|nr:colony stimulating factor 3 (granulocyte) a [Solea solea]